MKRLIIFVVLFCTSCTIAPRNFEILGVVGVENSARDTLRVELQLRNDSQDTLTLSGGEVAALMKGDAVVTFTLSSAVEIPPVGAQNVVSEWFVRRDDPATLYTLQGRPVARYIDKIKIDYSLQYKFRGKDKTLSGKGLKASKLNINLENLWQ